MPPAIKKQFIRGQIRVCISSVHVSEKVRLEEREIIPSHQLAHLLPIQLIISNQVMRNLE